MASAAGLPAPVNAKTAPSPLFGATIFLSAFLLFQVQLIIGKAILPWFGGTAAVWTTCMLVFQLLLLAGYAYAHFLSSSMSLRTQARVHIIVLAAALLTLLAGAVLWRVPILPSAAWKPQADGSPVLDIVRMLLAAIAVPFFVLSTTGSLVQRWFAHAAPEASPYRLYSLSNAGSLLGLLSYPFLVEPMLNLRTQAWTWSVLFLAFVSLCAVTARHAVSAKVIAESRPAPAEDAEPAPSKTTYVLWLALPACASAMLLATTNHICQEVAVIPFLWILPLSIYLLSFILTFDTPKWYRRGFFHPLYVIAVIGAVCGLARRDYSLARQINLALLAMFAVFMVMHGELVKLRPRTKHLTAFYLMVAMGGALGGIFVSIVAPHVFPAFWEYHISLFLCGLFAFCVLLIDRDSWLHSSRAHFGLLMVFVASLVPIFGSRFVDSDLFGIANSKAYYALVGILGVLSVAAFVRSRRRPNNATATVGGSRWVQAATAIVLVSIGILLFWQVAYDRREVVERRRSFFGVLTLIKTDKALAMRHGETLHGWQYFDPKRRLVPTSYYNTDTGVGLLMMGYPRGQQLGSTSLRVGVVGLGVGTLAAYSLPGDYFRFYEIDPQVVDMSMSSNPRFTFLQSSRATIDVTLGDGRLSLERESPQKFDILILDAFSSDSVPVHLLTREAMQIYRKHLRGPHSVLAFNITNRSLDLRPVLVGLAKDSGLSMIRAGVFYPSAPTQWVLMCQDRDWLLSIPGVNETAKDVTLSAEAPVWTDDYSNLLQALQF